jgi:phosphohistidine swiveling domain-containing protein
MTNFIKSYTRDNCLIIQEIWYNAFLKDVFGNNNPFIPPIIYYVEDGLVEIWEDKRGIGYYVDRLLEKNESDVLFFGKAMLEYREILDKLEPIWAKKGVDSLDQLENFIDLMEKGTKYFLIFYYSAFNKKTPKNIHEETMRFRNADAFYDKSHRVITDSLIKIYPEIKGLTFIITKKEIRNLPGTEELKERMKNYVFIPSITSDKKNIKDFLKENKDYAFKFDKLEVKNNILRGQSAYPGIVKGKVQIIKRKEQIRDMRDKRILVSPMTTPDFVPAMKKASAIVTDEGGITCHAAIVARELKKPCIIGTKVATQILKDGDLVEVDADNGIVRIIKKKGRE